MILLCKIAQIRDPTTIPRFEIDIFLYTTGEWVHSPDVKWKVGSERLMFIKIPALVSSTLPAYTIPLYAYFERPNVKMI